jgi:hypothetical protein
VKNRRAPVAIHQELPIVAAIGNAAPNAEPSANGYLPADIFEFVALIARLQRKASSFTREIFADIFYADNIIDNRGMIAGTVP